ncbi:MAG: aspartate aminotransferase family protein [Bacteroidales bacterium]|nr:aspartate aminotransferase family protein [Bacteroidales bacterium]MDD2263629.1 aspartate aminotransferase family protein [Bacteroidales bacterium]MDD2830580.1 aspartate aminotransferase family protein [Bacteroidales bacterium]MDD3208849.1 aspartate aminotransferase family protein [Bacteroidales bacterium]MDD3697426.1 aspartate aminotransferase family protein [Bacteroidales bacterium]
MKNRPTIREQFFTCLGQTSPSPLGIEIQKAEGVFLLSPEGKRYIDLISGVSVSNVGHSREEVVRAIREQAGNYLHLMVYGEVIQTPQVLLASLLTEQLPTSLNSVYFVNSGSEANEAALKLCKRITGRPKIICFRNAYHGSTHGALSVMGDESFRRSFRPLLPAVTAIRFNSMEDLELIDHDTACVIAEPIQAEAGVRLPDADFLQLLRKRCNDTGTLLIFDEIQTGFGRTGSLFAMQKYGVTPDMVTLAKALGGGMPLGALVCARELMDAWKSDPVLGHITTFGGHPVCCAAGLAALQVLLKEGWTEKVLEKSIFLKDMLSKHPGVLEIRGQGLLLAVELGSSGKVQRIIRLLLEEGAMADWFLFCDTAFRIAPPLCISDQELELTVRIITRALDRLK